MLQYLDEAAWTSGGRVVGCTQPRQVAAATVAARVADEMGVRLGMEVGYAVRFDNCTHPVKTRIKYMTDGVLIRETMLDPLLSRYSVLMIDEAHERSLQTDVLLGLLKKIRKKRPDLRFVPMLQTEAGYFLVLCFVSSMCCRVHIRHTHLTFVPSCVCSPMPCV